MAKQNIFDNGTFFDGYKALRSNEVNANVLFEIPALFSMMPSLSGKRVLDLGCGFGEHCRMFVEQGAECVVGIDISEKMLEVAKAENSHEKITYINMPIEDIGQLEGKFDVIVSSLAFHYVEDFEGAVANVHKLLTDGGVFIFSQEHPFVTSHTGGSRWTKDESGNKLHLNLANYGVEGERKTSWFVDNIKIYHRTFSTIVNELVGAGFTIEKMIEPVPTPQLAEKYPEHRDLFHKPDFLLLRVKKEDLTNG